MRTLLVSACAQLTDSCLAAIGGGMPRLACLGLFESGEEVTDEVRRLQRACCCSLRCCCCCCLHAWAGQAALRRTGAPPSNVCSQQMPCAAQHARAPPPPALQGLAHLAALSSSLTALDLGYSCWSHTAVGLAALLEKLPGLALLNVGASPGAARGFSGTPGSLAGWRRRTISVRLPHAPARSCHT